MFPSPKLDLNVLCYEDIAVGDTHSFERYIDEKIIHAFADMSGDMNPLHMDETYARKTQFGGRIAHGMLAASFFSALVGMRCPGRNALYLSQELRFKNPITMNTKITVSGRVIAKSDTARIITLYTMICDDKGIILIDGEAKIQVRI